MAHRRGGIQACGGRFLPQCHAFRDALGHAFGHSESQRHAQRNPQCHAISICDTVQHSLGDTKSERNTVKYPLGYSQRYPVRDAVAFCDP